jgi:hypothetical protein
MDVELFIACGYNQKKYQEEMDKRTAAAAAAEETSTQEKQTAPEKTNPPNQQTNQNNPTKGGKPKGSGDTSKSMGDRPERATASEPQDAKRVSISVRTTSGDNRAINRRNTFNQKWAETVDPPLNARIAFNKISSKICRGEEITVDELMIITGNSNVVDKVASVSLAIAIAMSIAHTIITKRRSVREWTLTISLTICNGTVVLDYST